MTIPKGYKQTEIGIIPVDWEVSTLGNYASFRTGPFGSSLHKSDYVNDEVPVINPMHIVDGRLKPSNTMTVTKETANRLSEFMVSAGEVIIGRRGDMGRCAVIQPENNGWLCGTGSMVIRPKGLNGEFLSRVLSSPQVISAIENASVGTTMVNLNQGTLSSLKLQIPPLPEQQAISTVLTDIDQLLTALDDLITKKRQIKQATLQSLLTAQTRLPGFEGEWKETKLANHVKFLKKGTNSRAELTVEGQVRYLHYGDIHTHSTCTLTPDNLPFLPEQKAKTLDRLQNGDLIFVDASEDIEGIGKSVEITDLGTTELVSGQHTIAARFDKSILADGFKAYLQFCPPFINHLRKLAAGTKVYATTKSHIASVVMPLPSIAEQTAIATLLTTLDDELTALASRRSKTESLKRGMMQSLLTGRTRLPTP